MDYKNLKLEEFITNILGVELNETQKHLVGMYEEIQGNKNISYAPSIPLINPTKPDWFKENELIKPYISKGGSSDKSIFLNDHTVYCNGDELMGSICTFDKLSEVTISKLNEELKHKSRSI